jgi:hypothetical protein
VAGLRNAFKYRLADRPQLDTARFLGLYCPTLLGQLAEDDFSLGRLMTVRGSPGSGKSTLLRLVQTETLLGLKSLASNQAGLLVDRLTELGAFHAGKLSAVGIYVLCDSNLRDIAHHGRDAQHSLFNTLLDNRIILSFLRNIERTRSAGQLGAELSDDMKLLSLPSDQTPPRVFAACQTIGSLTVECESIENSFANLLNSFPDDPPPEQIRPHSRLFSLEYLALQTQVQGPLKGLKPIVLLDDFQDLYEAQRSHLAQELRRRSAVPRWVATRKHIYPLEELLSVQGAQEGRDIRDLDLDDLDGAAFRRFAIDVANRRLQLSVPLQESGATEFTELLDDTADRISPTLLSKGAADAVHRLEALGVEFRSVDETVSFQSKEDVVRLETHVIVAERLATRRQQSLFASELDEDSESDAKTRSAAELFASRRFKIPYYYSGARVMEAANSNIEQFLGIASALAEKLIFRAELNRGIKLTASDQENVLKAHATAYYDRIPRVFQNGSAIRQLIDNVARIFIAITFRPNAPIAPGVTGIGIPKNDLEHFVALKSTKEDIQLLRSTLTMAVASGIFRVKTIKQGAAGRENVVLYINRLLCIHFGLPLQYGGWRPVRADQLVRMITRTLSNDELAALVPTALLDEGVA